MITSSGQVLIWGADNISGERSREIDVRPQMQSWIEKISNKCINIICVVTDSAGSYAAARFVFI